ncbi:MAG: glycerol-3-phosphate 1-O-acyltransferase PlsY [Phycisphaerales bacterium]|nr:glycerol-3-phosphate 1-O-acyltransferase PlsY [Phycisphaerales bacterium]
MIDWTTWGLAALGAYLVGSIPFGFLMGRMKGIDIREHGSRNIGATNVGRVLGRRLGIACFVLDAAKGGVPVAVAGMLGGTWGRTPEEIGMTSLWLWLAIACATYAGHVAPVWLRFRGGKGVATGFGALLAMWPVLTVPALVALAVWGGLLATLRYMSVASILAGVSIPITTAVLAVATADRPLAGLREAIPLLVVTSALAALTTWRHRTNIERLIRGEEPRISRSPSTRPPSA